MAQLVPFIEGMTRGQGYNTFVQQTQIRDAVTVQGDDVIGDASLEYNYELVESFEKLAKTLKISAGAAISGWGQNADLDSNYLTRSEWERSTFEYQVKVNVQYQGGVNSKHTFNKIASENPNKTYGNRYIAEFIRGGSFFARVSIRVRNSSKTEEVMAAAKVAFTMYGATGTVTTKVETALDTIYNNSEVKVMLNENTGNIQVRSISASNSSPSDLLAIKERADNFYEAGRAGKHKFIRFARLESYTKLPNFNNSFTPFDYTDAEQRAWVLFDEFTLYMSLDGVIRKIPVDKYTGGTVERNRLISESADQTESIRQKIQNISLDPTVAKIESEHTPAADFRKKLFNSIKTATYIAQSRILDPQNETDIAQKTLIQGARKLFEFKAYDFEHVFGSTIISFGKSNNAKEGYGCFIGNRATANPGWREESYFWAFPDTFNNIANVAVAVSILDSKNHVRLERGKQAFARDRFSFFTLES